MINLRPLCKKIKCKGWWDIKNTSTFCYGTFIYHTKKNPNRKHIHALSVDGIANRKRHCKARWPLRWWLQEELGRKISKCIDWIPRYYTDISLWFMHRFVKKHQYNIIQPRTLVPGYYNTETRLIHSMFELVVSFVDDGFDNVDWYNKEWNDNYPTDKKKPCEIAEEIKELYNWWVEVYPNRKLPAAPKEPEHNCDNFMMIFSHKYKDDPYRKLFSQWSAEVTSIEESWASEDTEMMIKVIELRRDMWE